ncbi:MAG: ABC transporter ATP-binding protein [Actinomycetota bacterium]|nr:ABC transporter ATP-binding protein [Actinomycetota bacterium]
MRHEIAARCENVIKIYWASTGEVHALKGIDASFTRGGVTAIVGPSGSGKSSLLRILAGLDRPTAGSVIVGSNEISALPTRKVHAIRRRHLGYVFQRPSDNLISDRSVAAHVEDAARRRNRVVQVDDLLDHLGIVHRRSHHPHELSGGEQQRLAFAQAIAGGPDLVIADEPTAELDSASAGDLLAAVRRLAKAGSTFVMSTHDPQVVAAADATLFLRHGAVEAETILDRLSVIDVAGRIQLPPEALRMFPNRRAVLHIGEDELRITPP